MARMEAHDVALARARVREGGFTFVPGSDMRPWLEAGGALAKWEVFAASWEMRVCVSRCGTTSLRWS